MKLNIRTSTEYLIEKAMCKWIIEMFTINMWQSLKQTSASTSREDTKNKVAKDVI